MKPIFEEYGLFIFTSIVAILAIGIFLSLFTGDGALLAPFFSDWLAKFGLH